VACGAWSRPDGTMASWVNVGGNKTWPAPQGPERAARKGIKD